MALSARELDQLRHQRRHLGQLVDDVGQEPLPLPCRQRALAREHLDVRAQARERRPQLVRRVGDELVLGARRLLECAEHRVEAVREARQLVLAARVDPLGEVARRPHALRSLRQAPDRSERGQNVSTRRLR